MATTARKPKAAKPNPETVAAMEEARKMSGTPNATSIDAMLEARKMSKTKKEAASDKKLDQVCESVEMIMEVIGATHPHNGIWSKLYLQIKGEAFKTLTKEYVAEVVAKERVEVLALRSELEQSRINFNLLAEEVLRLQRQAYGPKPFLGVPPGPFTGKPLKHFKGSLHNPDPGYFPVHPMTPYGDFCPPFTQPGQYPQFQNSPYVTNPTHPGELLQRIMGLESAVAQLQQRQSSSMFQPNPQIYPQQFQSQFQVPPMSTQPSPAQMPHSGHKSDGTTSMQTLQEEGANKIYTFVEQKLIKEEKFTLNDLFQAIGPGFQWSRYVTNHSFHMGWLSEVLRNAPANTGFVYKPAMCFADSIIERKN